MPMYHTDHALPPSNEDWIHVFSSNLMGSIGPGSSGSNRWYGVPVKTSPQGPRVSHSVLVDLCAIFIRYAKENPGMKFWVMDIDDRAGALLMDAPGNCSLPESWRPTTVAQHHGGLQS